MALAVGTQIAGEFDRHCVGVLRMLPVAATDHRSLQVAQQTIADGETILISDNFQCGELGFIQIDDGRTRQRMHQQLTGVFVAFKQIRNQAIDRDALRRKVTGKGILKELITQPAHQANINIARGGHRCRLCCRDSERRLDQL